MASGGRRQADAGLGGGQGARFLDTGSSGTRTTGHELLSAALAVCLIFLFLLLLGLIPLLPLLGGKATTEFGNLCLKEKTKKQSHDPQGEGLVSGAGLAKFEALLKPPPRGSGRRNMPSVRQAVNCTNWGLQSDQVALAKLKEKLGWSGQA